MVAGKMIKVAFTDKEAANLDKRGNSYIRKTNGFRQFIVENSKRSIRTFRTQSVEGEVRYFVDGTQTSLFLYLKRIQEQNK